MKSNITLRVLYSFILIVFLTSCAIILKNPIIVHNDRANGDIDFHKELEETRTSNKEQTSRKQTEVTSSVRKRVGGVGDIDEVNNKIEAYDKQKDAQLKKVEQTLKTDSIDSPKAQLEMLRVQLIDAKIRRTLCKNNYMTIQADTLSSEQSLRDAKECWENSEEQVMTLVSEINLLKKSK